MMERIPVDQAQAIEAYQRAAWREREARKARLRAETALEDATDAHSAAGRAKEDAWRQLDPILCGQDETVVAQQMVAQIDRAFNAVATSIGAAQSR